MQNSNEPIQQTDKNKGDQSAVEQQQKETLKKPSPENMSGAEKAQQTGQGNEDENMGSNRPDNQRQDKDKNQANKGGMGGSKQGEGPSKQGQ